MLVELFIRAFCDTDAYPLAAAVGATTVAVAGLVVAALTVIGWWGIFRKAGVPGWKAVIPVYNEYVRCRISGTRIELFAGELVFLVASLVFSIPQVAALTGGAPRISDVCFALYVFIYAVVCFNTSKSFGGDLGLAAALLFLEPIVSIYLGFGGPTYAGPARPDSRLMPFNLDRYSTEGDIVEKDGHLTYRDRPCGDDTEGK